MYVDWSLWQSTLTRAVCLFSMGTSIRREAVVVVNTAEPNSTFPSNPITQSYADTRRGSLET